MKNPINNDNLYAKGQAVTAHLHPEVKLTITDYKARIYYCTAVGDAENKSLAYFERELLPSAR